MREADIMDALCVAVDAAVAASTIPTMPIMFPLRTFNIPEDNKYIEVIQIVNNRENEYWGKARTYQGILRLLLHWKNDDAGAIVPMQFLDSIAELIPKGSILRSGAASVLIYDNPDAGSMITDGSDVIFPLTFVYRDFQPDA